MKDIHLFIGIFAILVILYLPNDAFAETFTITTDDNGLDGSIRESNNNNSCTNAGSFDFFVSLVNNLVRTDANPSPDGDCWRAVQEFDISDIPSGSTINSVNFTYQQVLTDNMGATSCDWVSLDVQPSLGDTSAIWDSISDGGTGTVMLNANIDCRTDESNKLIELGAIGITELQDHINNQLNWFAIGVKQNDETINGSQERFALLDGGQSPTPVPTLTVDYTPPLVVSSRTIESDDITVKTDAKIAQVNSTTSRTITVNSTGFADFSGLSGLQNFTGIETVDNIIFNFTINYNASNPTNPNSPFNMTHTDNVYEVSCPNNGPANDVRIKINYTDAHMIDATTTPTCNTGNEITWNVDYTSHGGASGNQEAKMIARIRNTTA